MSVKIISKTLENEQFKFNAMAFISPESANNGTWALMTHGYTANKADCINWASRLSDAGINSVIFDLPGHYLGSYHEVASLEQFTNHAHECFETAFDFLETSLSIECKNLVICGHSLGALLSLKASSLPKFKTFNKIVICVGYGLNQNEKTHVFDTPIYQKTINIRRQLVHPSIDSDLIFPWIKKYKEEIEIKNQRVHLICGKDDVVVGDGGMNYLKEQLEVKGNIVSANEPNRLPHNNPELAASHIFSFLKKELNLS